MTRPLKIFCDFDGTISLNDDCDRLVDHCMGREARQAIDNRILFGQISLREGMAAQFAGITLTWAEACRFIDPRQGLDPGFPVFVRRVEQAGVPPCILSSGIKPLIKRYLAAVQLDHLEVRANRIEIQDRRWRVIFRDNTPLGHDKAAALREAQALGYRTVFIGDGISDIPAARAADSLFARQDKPLAAYCDQQGIAYVPFLSFLDILTHFTL